MWDYYKSFSHKKYIVGSQKCLTFKQKVLIQIAPVMVAGNVSSNEARADLLDSRQIVLTFECKPGSDLCDWYNMNSFELDQQNLSAAPIWWIQQTVVHFHKKRDCRWNINLDLKVDFLSIWHKVLSCKCDLNLHCLWVAINDKHIDPSMNCYR